MSAETPGVLTGGEAQQVATGLALLVHNTLRHHWFSATDARETLVAYYAQVSGVLTRVPEIPLRVAGETLRVGDTPPREVDRPIETLVAQFKLHRISQVAFRRGIALAELQRFVDILVAGAPAPDSGAEDPVQALVEVAGAHIGFRTFRDREMSEDDVVLSRQELAAAGVAAAEGDAVSSEDVLAYLAGREKPAVADASGPLVAADDSLASGGRGISAAAADGISRLAADTKRLAALVLQAARAQPADAGGLAQALTQAMNRAFEVWHREAGAKTQTGRKRTRKQLRALEREVLDLLETALPEDAARAAAGQAVRETTEALDDALHVDVLAAEYLRRVKAMEQTEQRLQRYLHTRGGEADAAGLVARLQDGGLTPEHLEPLLGAPAASAAGGAEAGGDVEPGPGGGPGGSGAHAGSGPGGGGAGLEVLLEAMPAAAAMRGGVGSGSGAGEGDELDRLLDGVQGELQAIMDRAAGSIRFLTDAVQADAQSVQALEDEAAAAGRPLRLTRGRLLELLAEIVQELCQPLSVVQCTLDMLASGRMGEVSPGQVEMIALATESARHLQALIDGLKAVAGNPDALAPDRDLIQRVVQA